DAECYVRQAPLLLTTFATGRFPAIVPAIARSECARSDDRLPAHALAAAGHWDECVVPRWGQYGPVRHAARRDLLFPLSPRVQHARPATPQGAWPPLPTSACSTSWC